MSCEEDFLKKLREHGFRLTPQREMVLSTMHKIDGFATVDEIYAQVKILSSAVDISTVYRTLDLLQGFDLVDCVDPGNGQRRYELLGVHGRHVHLVCNNCGTVIGIELEYIQPLAEQLEAQQGFAIDLDHLTVPGLCRACVEAQITP